MTNTQRLEALVASTKRKNELTRKGNNQYRNAGDLMTRDAVTYDLILASRMKKARRLFWAAS